MEGITKTYQTYESVKDTIIDNKDCRMIIENNRIYEGAPPDTIYMYSRNDSIFFRENDKFCLLYDFSAEKGDTIRYDCIFGYEGSPLEVIIDTVYKLEINGNEKIIQTVKTLNGWLAEFSGNNIEGIGNQYHLFPFHFEYFGGPLRCYFDEKTGWFKNPFYTGNQWDMENCEQVVRTSIQEKLITKFEIYPNPIQSFITIQPVYIDDTPYDLKIFDMYGRKVKELISVRGVSKVDMSGLSKGIYVVQVNIDSKIGFAKVFKE